MSPLAAARQELRLFFLALQFFTRVPVPAWVGWDAPSMHASARHYPAVGLVVGAWGAGITSLAALLWPPLVAAGLGMAATVWLTGGFHEDGLADTCDGLGGAVSREKALLIMKDSRLGSYGALGLVAVLGLKAATLSELLASDALLAPVLIVWVHAVSRVVPTLMLRALPYAGDLEHAKAKPMAQQAGNATLAVALGWAVLATLGALWVTGDWAVLLIALAALAAAGVWCWRWFKRRLGGYTGDNLGASQQLSELAACLGALAAVGAGL